MAEKFNFFDKNILKSGKEFKIDVLAYCSSNELQEELTNVLNSDFEKNKDVYKAIEKDLYSKAIALTKRWEDISKKLLVFEMAESYLEACRTVENLQTTNNEWIQTKDSNTEIAWKISNKTFIASIDCYFYDFKIPCYKVNYYLSINGINNQTLTSISKNFKNRDDALKYIEGRKSFLGKKYFVSLWQPVPLEYKHYFLSCDKLINGYSIT